MDDAPQQEAAAPAWQPLCPIDRRIAGVLVEKAKTTPDQYPLTLNSIRTGANQKSNRHPVVAYEADEVQESLDRLRGLGAVVEVFGSGRTPKYRHTMYEWLGVDKVELAVMTELLLRGPQTVGELRGRAARMDPIADVAALRPVLASLKQKQLVVPLNPEGRGHAVTHGLYSQDELDRIVREFRGASGNPETHTSAVDATPSAAPATAPSPTQTASPLSADIQATLDDLRMKVAELQDSHETVLTEMARLRQQVDAIREDLGA